MTVSTLREGQFKLNEFVLSAPGDRTIGLAAICSRADIFESVLEPTVIGEFIIADKVGVFSHFNFLEQKINISFTTYEENEDASVEYEFYPISVDPAVSLPDDKGIVYKLTCVSKEALKSTQIKNAPLVRQKTPSEKIVEALLGILDTDKNYFFEETQGLHAFNFTEMTPFEAIDQVRLKSMSKNYNGHCFLFYENSKGYHFKSFESLMDDGKKKIGDKYFMQFPAGELNIQASKWRNILGFKVVQTGNQNVTRAIGAGKVLVKRKNLITGQIEDFQIDQKKLDFVRLNENSISSNATTQKEAEENESNIKLVYYDPTIEESDSANAEVVRPYFMAHLLNTVAHITIYGDSTITIGDVIAAEIPEHDGLTLGEENPYRKSSEIVSGNYLVTKCRHILNFNEGAQYIQALEIVKDGYGGDIPNASFTTA